MIMNIALQIHPPAAAAGGQGDPGGGAGDPMEILFLDYAQRFPADGSEFGRRYQALLSQIVNLEQAGNDQARECLERAEDLYARLEGIAIRAFYRRGFQDALRLIAESGLDRGP